ncbi:WbqC family protein [Cylindrospermopsis curvispora]|uniref:WbqC family protein n=1 Tax=Cylindrospermopsis curvispora GIHE-G1 TaxID=2666332 RepID=A0A7H0F1R6_9CYAN|nr:WbqC family protein [Cylindrospermopsis curvispora]QNP29982.1 WbqC family protein [Cylindrospermopsis curvispora GIHE-G1]
MKKIAIVQSNYIPWKGYFDLINSVDEFILFDDMQYTKRDWRNRNKIKTNKGLTWLTIPVQVKGKYYQKIKDTEVSDVNWRHEHWKSITYNYTRSNYFKTYQNTFESLYLNCQDIYLSQINYQFIVNICEILGVRTKISWSMDYDIVEGKTERLISLCEQAGGTEYISGPSARDYIDANLFQSSNIKLSYIDYSNYPEYHQLFPPFEHGVSVIDLIFNEGENAKKYMNTFS